MYLICDFSLAFGSVHFVNALRTALIEVHLRSFVPCEICLSAPRKRFLASGPPFCYLDVTVF